MYDKYELKERLREIKNNDFRSPDDISIFDFTLNMIEYIGDPDPDLRDNLIYEVLDRWIMDGMFGTDQLSKLLNIIFDSYHLFYKIGEEGTDSVFTRSFSVLIVADIIYYYRIHNTGLEEDLRNIKEKLIKYMSEEKDVRGYISGKGWAHSAAHTGDALNELVQCRYMKYKDLLEIMEAVKKKIFINSYAYISGEDERLTTPIVSIIDRKILGNKDIVDWIRSFKNINKISKYPEDMNLEVNVRNFLRSVYFRLLYKDNYDEINGAIKETLYNIKKF